MFPNYAPWLTGFISVFVLALWPFLPMWALFVSDFWFYMHADCTDPDNSQKKQIHLCWLWSSQKQPESQIQAEVEPKPKQAVDVGHRAAKTLVNLQTSLRFLGSTLWSSTWPSRLHVGPVAVLRYNSLHHHGTILLFWGRNILLIFISQVCTSTDGPLIGDCLTDTFTVTSPGEFSTRTFLLLLIKKSDRIFSLGSPSPPVICGYNTGQHM